MHDPSSKGLEKHVLTFIHDLLPTEQKQENFRKSTQVTLVQILRRSGSYHHSLKRIDGQHSIENSIVSTISHSFLFLMDIILVILATYLVITVTTTVGFTLNPIRTDATFLTALFAIHLIWCLCIVDRNNYTVSVKVSYLRGWFIVDLLSSIPLVSNLHPVLAQNRYISLFIVLRLSISFRIFRKHYFLFFTAYSSVWRIFLLFYWCSTFLHILFCVFWPIFEYEISFRSPKYFQNGDLSLEKAYTYGFFEVVLLVVGDNVGPSTRLGRQCCWCMIILGALCFTIFIVNISTVTSKINQNEKEHYKKRQDAVQLCRDMKISGNLQHRILAYLEYKWLRNGELRGSNKISVFEDLSSPLATEYHLFRQKYLFLRQFSTMQEEKYSEFLSHLIQKVGVAFALPGDFLFYQGSIGNAKFNLVKGSGAYIHYNDDQTARVLHTILPGDTFGFVSLIHKAQRTATMRISTHSEYTYISSSTFRDAVRRFPVAGNAMIEHLQNMILCTNELHFNKIYESNEINASNYSCHDSDSFKLIFDAFENSIDTGCQLLEDTTTIGIELVNRKIQQECRHK